MRPTGSLRTLRCFFVTVSENRLENVRGSLADLPEETSEFYLFGLLSEVVEDFLGEVWRGRQLSDNRRYRLVADTRGKTGAQAPLALPVS
jgi:hypothetical protein